VLLLVAGLAYVAYYASVGQNTSSQSSSGAFTPTVSSTSSESTSGSSTLSSLSVSSSESIQDNGNWTTYHKDSVRSGYEQAGNITNVAAGWRLTGLDGSVYAEPLVLGDAVFVATENNSVYSIDTEDGTVDWRTNLGAPVSGSSLPCGDIDPSGITGTPVIDNTTETLYVVAFLNPAHHVLFGLNVYTGNVVSQVTVDPTGADPAAEQQRGALAFSDGVVYIPYGGLYGDCGDYHGWVVGVDENGTTPLLSYQVPTDREGGIWASGGIAVDANENLVVATGNGDSTTAFDHGDSVILLSPSLQEIDYFAPTNWAQLNSGDTDLGSLAPTVLPNGDIFQAGKGGVGYLLSDSSLGGIGGQLYESGVCSSAFGGTAHVGQTLFLPCTDGLVQVHVGRSNFTVGWRASGFFAGSPIVTGNVVWVPDVDNSTLLGYDLATGALRFSFSLGGFVHFQSPSAGDGMLFVTGGTKLYSFVLGSSG
jgi:outer membrane protein assembly factor BamB